MAKRLVLIALLSFFAFRAEALEYTDVWYTPSEAGWGVFLVQSDATQFLAFFIYGSDTKPTWYTAQLAADGTGAYTGPLFAISGTYFVQPWQGYTIAPAGTASFRPVDAYHATLTYTVNNLPQVTKNIQRQVLTAYVMGGSYSGSMSGAISGCVDPTANDPAFRGRYGLTVTQGDDTSIEMTFNFVDANHNGINCALTGALAHFGRLYQSNGQLSCTGPGQNGSPRAVTIDGLHPTGQGIEGHLTGNLGGGCAATLHFSAVRNVNN